MYTPGDMGSKIRQKAGNSQVTTNSQKGCKSGLFVLGGGGYKKPMEMWGIL